jgi:LCP family protein required for cell wall assembly
LDRYADSQVSDAHGTGVQADFLLLMVLDHETRQCTALQVNRDAMTKVNKLAIGGTAVVESYTAQIAMAYNAVNDDNDKIRCRNTVDSLEYLLPGVDVDHYFALTMDAVAASCDAVGGVEVTVLDDFTGIDDALVKGKTVTLTGQQALRYVRTRYGMEDSSNSTRMERQRQYLDALYRRLFEKMNEDQGFAMEFAQALDGHVAYDSSDRRLQMLLEKVHEYEYLGIRQLEGQTRLGEKFMEFYPDEASVLQTVIELYYTPKTKGKQ